MNSSLFSVSENLTISGPAAYMQDRFPLLKKEIESGNSVVFNYALRYKGADLKNALLVAVQTDYSSWKGTKELIDSLR